MKRKIAIGVEVFYFLSFTLLFFTDGVGMFLYFIGAFVLGNLFFTGLGVLIRKHNPKKLSYFYPHVIIGILVVPAGIILTFTTPGWDALGYAFITIGVIAMIIVSIPFYFILEDYLNTIKRPN